LRSAAEKEASENASEENTTQSATEPDVENEGEISEKMDMTIPHLEKVFNVFVFVPSLTSSLVRWV
jgi:hypothetical protein